MSIEVMKRALAKFEHLWEIGIDAEYKVELLPEIEALRQAIEQAEQWDTSDMAHRSGGLAIDDDDIQEYKRPWVGMSDVEIAIYSSGFSGVRLAREIEAQLKERNNG
jgi:hypothetical protein